MLLQAWSQSLRKTNTPANFPKQGSLIPRLNYKHPAAEMTGSSWSVFPTHSLYDWSRAGLILKADITVRLYLSWDKSDERERARLDTAFQLQRKRQFNLQFRKGVRGMTVEPGRFPRFKLSPGTPSHCFPTRNCPLDRRCYDAPRHS